MSFAAILGQEHVKVVLRRALAQGRLGHAYLFHGQRGLGKSSMATALAQAVNCSMAGVAAEPCGACRDCSQVASDSHPDVHWVAPSPASIRIEQVREVIRQAAMRPYAGRRKVFIFRDADRLTDEAGNALLKILEDPPGHALFILLTHNPDGLLPTVRSRCQPVPFRPVAVEELARHLAASALLEEGEARRLAVLARGNPGVARLLAEGGVRRQAGEAVQRVFDAVSDPGRTWSELLRLAEELETWDEDAEAPLGLLDWLSWGCRDLLVAALGGREQLLGIHGPAGFAARPGGAALFFRWLKAIEQARRALGDNGNRRLVWEVLLQRLHGEMRKAII